MISEELTRSFALSEHFCYYTPLLLRISKLPIADHLMLSREFFLCVSENYSFIFTRTCLNLKKKKDFSRATSRGLHWNKKQTKLKMSIEEDLFVIFDQDFNGSVRTKKTKDLLVLRRYLLGAGSDRYVAHKTPHRKTLYAEKKKSYLI